MDMNKEDKKDLSALDSLEQKLYDPKEKGGEIVPHHVRDRREKELPTSWSEDTPIIRALEDNGGLSFGAKFLIGAMVLLILVLSFTAWRVLSSRNVVSEKNIDMELTITPYIEGGEATPLTVSLNNRNEVSLEEATLTLMYKQGTGAQDEQEKVQVKKNVGTVSSGDFKREDFEVSVYGSESEARDITVKLEYKVEGSNAIFSKVVVTQVVLKSPPISVHIIGPDTLSSGQVGTFDVAVKNNTATTTTPSLLMLTLPSNFTLEESVPKQSARGTVWQVKPLEAGETFTVKLTGSVSGAQGEVATMKAVIGSVGGSLTEVGVVYSSETVDIKLRSSPLVTTLTLDSGRGPESGLRYGDQANLSITYKNTSSEPLQDVSLLLTIGGNAALMKDVKPQNGYYDSAASTILWNRASLPTLATLAPGAEGVVTVLIPVVTKGSNSPKLTLSLIGKATAKETNDVVTNAVKSYVVQGSASLSAKTQYKNSPFQNTGPIPPEANVDTTYTLHLTVSAQNALQNAKVSFVLPAYVTWRNVASDTSLMSYDAKTRTVTWNVGRIDAGKIVSNDIGVAVRPSQVHVNTSPFITGGIVLEADEVESRSHIRTAISGLTTYIGGESWTVNPSVVVDK
jgi:hypothetical protein